jgi:hypothetical protein
MKKFLLFLLLFIFSICFSNSQMVGGQIFLQGAYTLKQNLLRFVPPGGWVKLLSRDETHLSYGVAFHSASARDKTVSDCGYEDLKIA